MNPGTFYLYEYENNKRTRNVGFIRVSCHYRSCILQVNARGIPLPNGVNAELYAFFRSDDNRHLCGLPAASLTCLRKSISARISVPECRFPEGRPLTRIDGFIIRLPSDRTSRFWMASEYFFDVDISLLVPPASSRNEAEEPAESVPDSTDLYSAGEVQAAEKNAAKTETDTAQETTAADRTDTAQEMTDADRTDTAQETAAADRTDTAQEAAAADRTDTSQETETADGTDTSQEISAPSVEKISREDISRLPRRFWPLASNSFLLHGYRCYGHLILAEEDGRMWLGVPGIYDSREARAADLFGFPRFTRVHAAALDLSEEERSTSNDFGHWCRCIGPALSRIPGNRS